MDICLIYLIPHVVKHLPTCLLSHHPIPWKVHIILVTKKFRKHSRVKTCFLMVYVANNSHTARIRFKGTTIIKKVSDPPSQTAVNYCSPAALQEQETAIVESKLMTLN